MTSELIFLTSAPAQLAPAVQLLVNSLRSFGGELAGAQFWIASTDPEAMLRQASDLENDRTHVLALEIPPELAAYPFGRTVSACAQAERRLPPGVNTLVWIDPLCLIVQPPILLHLGSAYDAAFRPVHIRNIGQPVSEPLDAFWQGIYGALGQHDLSSSVTSFVDGQRLRAYFNSHSFAVNPGIGMMQRWQDLFLQMVGDAPFQESACADERHQIFLFQAVLSALAAATLPAERLKILPPTYNYPYNLHAQVPPERRAAALNDLVSFTYEGRSIFPESVNDVQINEPLRSWLQARAARDSSKD